MLAFLILLLTLLGADPHWTPPAARDQGSSPQCVAYALAGWEASPPGPVPAWAQPSAAWIYATAQARDGLARPHTGTFVSAGWAALAAAGYIDPVSVRRTQDRQLGAIWLERAPVIVESDWYSSMDVAPGGQLTVIYSPEHRRHAYECYGTEGHGAVWDCLNSWGPAWGDHGTFRLRAADLDTLLRADGHISQADKLPRDRQ